ncbi:hypothetical protein HanIR_Chr02g0090111 [Helianthus annuus]|nr:hypothetical protein HanIR_Chr02g0090111 [Helianthus annuus]
MNSPTASPTLFLSHTRSPPCFSGRSVVAHGGGEQKQQMGNQVVGRGGAGGGRRWWGWCVRNSVVGQVVGGETVPKVMKKLSVEAICS